MIAFIETVLWRTGETWPIRTVLEAQRIQPERLFMRGILDQGFYRYKSLQLQRRNPKVAVLGSSRVMEFRSEMFGVRSNEFFNAGGMIQDLSDLKAFVQTLSPERSPEVVILGLDLWWFNGNKALLHGLASGHARDAAFDWQEHARAFRRFKSSKTRQPALAAWRAANQNVGIEARRAGVGFRGDGSMQYNFPAPKSGAEWRFIDREDPPIVERIAKNSAQFTPCPGIARERLELLQECLDALRAKHVLVLGFLPPFSSPAAALLQTSAVHSNLWTEVRREIPRIFQSRSLPCVDGSTPRDLGLDDSYMIDGLHGAETLHLQLLARFLDDPRAQSAFPQLAPALVRALTSPETNPWHPDYRPFFQATR